MKTTSLFRSLSLAASAASLTLAVSAATLVSDLEDTGLAPDEFWNGDDGSEGFYSGHVWYRNAYEDYGAFKYWEGFALSRVNFPNHPPSMPGFMNQYAVWGEGTDLTGDGTYAVVYTAASLGDPPTLRFLTPSLVRGFYVNNTAYAALALLEGRDGSKMFSLDDGDWFRLRIHGADAADKHLGTVEVYLADYRIRPYVLNQWRWVDLTALGSTVHSLVFDLDSTDVGTWGMNTPAYFAMDGLEYVPQAAGSMVATLENAPLRSPGQLVWKGTDGPDRFQDAAVAFHNHRDASTGHWSGFALSRATDPASSDPRCVVWHSAGGAEGSIQYAVGCTSNGWSRIEFPFDAAVEGFHVNNIWASALAMRDGATPAKRFGGISGNDSDWFRLTVTGKGGEGQTLGTKDFYLADYRFSNNTLDYIVQEWTWVDLSEFDPGVRALQFALTSSDTVGGEMRTPPYFALDNLTYRYVPASALGGSGSCLDDGIPGFVLQGNSAVQNPAFVGWATSVVSYAPAPGVMDPFDDPDVSLGPVSGFHRDVVSLGDLDAVQLAEGVPPGVIVLGFDPPIRDGTGPDFAVFENAFRANVFSDESLVFSELAYVEVSSDGIHFSRFPSRYDTTLNRFLDDGQYMRPRNVHNLAGKHVNNHGNNSLEPSDDAEELLASCFGTPFDLADLANDPLVQEGFVDVGWITQVRIVDIPGNGSFLDSRGRPIYDPWVTTSFFGNGGFDLAGVGVLNAVLPGETDRGVSLSWIADQRLVGDPTEAQERDLDNDGQKAWQEFYAGTDPNDPASRLQISEVRVENGTVRVAWQGSQRGSDIDFTLQRRTSLTNGDWTNHEVDVPRAAGNTQSWEGTAPTGDGAFFRVLVKTPEPDVP